MTTLITAAKETKLNLKTIVICESCCVELGIVLILGQKLQVRLAILVQSYYIGVQY